MKTTYNLHHSSALRGACDQCRCEKAVAFCFVVIDSEDKGHTLQFCSDECAEHHATVTALIKLS